MVTTQDGSSLNFTRVWSAIWLIQGIDKIVNRDFIYDSRSTEALKLDTQVQPFKVGVHTFLDSWRKTIFFRNHGLDPKLWHGSLRNVDCLPYTFKTYVLFILVKTLDRYTTTSILIHGNSLKGAHAQRNLCYSTWSRHFITSRTFINRTFVSEKTLFSFMRAQHLITI